MGDPKIRHYEKYLGLPSLIGRRKNASFEYIKERVWKKLQGWEEKLLLQAGREILIEAVVQAIPTYLMSCFKLPIGLCDEIEALDQKFWWGQRGECWKIHWVKWKAMCKPKSEGGMGFKDLAMFNDAQLAKQAWRLLHNKNSMFYQVFKARFFPNCSILEALDSTKGWYAWRSILHGRDVLKKRARWRVGNGEGIWGDAWLPSLDSPRLVNPMGVSFPKIRVSSLIKPPTRSWNVELLQGLFSPKQVNLIRSIPLGNETTKDKITWPYTQFKVYSVKSDYYYLSMEKSGENAEARSPELPQIFWKFIWSLSC